MMHSSYTPRQKTSQPTTRPKSKSTATNRTTAVINLDIHLQRATVGHDISPSDQDLLVLFRRNSKEITSEPTRWRHDHVAVWNQHIAIQTSLLKNKSGGSDLYQKKDYEIVLVALPSHAAVALFTIDFADVVAPNRANSRHQSYRLAPEKCRDLAASLEFDLTWEFAGDSNSLGPKDYSLGSKDYNPSVPNTPKSLNSVTNGPPPVAPSATILSQPMSNPTAPIALNGMPPPSLLLAKLDRDQGKQNMGMHSNTYHDNRNTGSSNGHSSIQPPNSGPMSSQSTRRRGGSVLSQTSSKDSGDQHSLDGAHTNSQCGDCATIRGRLERRDGQLRQVDGMLKDTQKRFERLVVEKDELQLREAAESRNAKAHRAMNLRFLQEMEIAFAFCFQKSHQSLNRESYDDDISGLHDGSISWDDLTPELQFMQNVKQWHQEFESWASQDRQNSESGTRKSFPEIASMHIPTDFDFAQELDLAIERNEKLRNHFNILRRAMRYNNDDEEISPPTEATPEDDVTAPVVYTMTEQLNNVERENYALKAKLSSATERLKKYSSTSPKAAMSGTVLSVTDQPSETTSITSNGTSTLSIEAGAHTVNEDNGATINRLKLQLVDVSEENTALVNQVEELEQKLQAEQESAATAWSKVNTLQNQLNDLEAEYEKSLTQLENQSHIASAARAELNVENASNASDNRAGTSVDSNDVIELNKQLKMSKQEVMQLRFRLSQLQSVQEKFDEISKQKKTLEAKVTSLEGQLFDSREHHTTQAMAQQDLSSSQDNQVAEAHREIARLETDLSEAHALHEVQIRRLEEEYDAMLDRFEGKVKQCEAEIQELLSRHGKQEARIDELEDQKADLKVLLDEMTQELSRLGKEERVSSEKSMEPMRYEASREGNKRGGTFGRDDLPPSNRSMLYLNQHNNDYTPKYTGVSSQQKISSPTGRSLSTNQSQSPQKSVVSSTRRRIDRTPSTDGPRSRVADLIQNFSKQ